MIVLICGNFLLVCVWLMRRLIVCVLIVYKIKNTDNVELCHAGQDKTTKNNRTDGSHLNGSTLDGLLWEMNEAEIVDEILKLSGTNMIIDNEQR